MTDDLERSERRLIEVLSQNLPGGTEENYERPHSGYPMSLPRLEPSTYRIQA
jgi:hypothetical protein